MNIFQPVIAMKFILVCFVSLVGLSASDLDEKLKLQQQESTRRENVLVMRLATKEQEMQELLVCFFI